VREESWIQHIHDAIRQHNIKMIRISIQDTSNVSRVRYVPAHNFLESIGGTKEISFPSAVFSFDTSAKLQPDVGQGFAGGYPSWRLKLDLRTFGVLPYSPGVARVIADVVTDEGEAIRVAPRQLLREVLEQYKELGYRVRGSFEYEFYVLKDTAEGLKPVWDGLQCFSETKQSGVEDIIGDVLHHLSEMGAGPEVANTEYGSGQFEVSNSPFWGVEISDMAFYYRSSIKEILARKGYKATFMSKPHTDMSGSGAHLHHSVYDINNRNLFYDSSQPDGLSQIGKWFIGGQLRHARSISALVNSTVNSYKRLQPHSFAPYKVTWGYDNRTCMIRIPPVRGEDTRIENRLPGADTDPYVALAVILAAGLDGIRQQIEPSNAEVGEGASLTEADALPRSLGEALHHLEHDSWAHEALGETFLQHYIKLRKAENERFLQSVTDWERNEYQDLF